MEKALIVGAIVGGIGIALWGWGWAIRRGARVEPLPVPLTCALGLGGVIFLGGILNLARIAYGGVLDGLLAVGVILAVAGFGLGKRGSFHLTWRTALAAFPLLVAAWLVATYLTPWRAFNHHDDFERYFAYPVRMLATGTLAGNPLGYMGGDTLGGQAFLQGFAAAHWPVAHVGDVDSLFGLLLCLALAGFAVAPGRWAVGAIVAELSVVAVNPQLVNVSALFTGAALMMAAVFVSGRPGSSGSADKEPSAFLLGLLYAALIVLKTTNAAFVVIHALVLVAVGPGEGPRRLRWLATAGLWTTVFILPWILVHAPLYLAAAQPLPPLPLSARPLGEPLGLFSAKALHYGSGQLHYSVVALAAVAVAGLTWLAIRRGGVARSWCLGAVIAAGASLGAVYFGFVVAGGRWLFGVEAATRYACPVMIGVLPAMLRMGEFATGSGRSRLSRTWPLALGAGVVAMFAPSLINRVTQITDSGVPLAYYSQFNASDQSVLLAYTHEVLEGSVGPRLRSIQAMVPAHEGLAAWVMTPFLLDFSRNPVWHTDPYGIGMRWARLPADCRYFLLEHDGYAVRPFEQYRQQLVGPGLADRMVAARTLAFIGKMQDLMRRGKIMYADESYVLVRLPD